MVNNMTYQLEMSFIPNPDIAPKFFLWITDQHGEPMSLPYPVLQSLLNENNWTRQFTKEHVYPMQMVVVEKDIVEVTGMAVDMVNVFHALMQEDLKAPQLSRFSLGASFTYWAIVAKSIYTLIDHGQYFPVLFSFADNHRRCLIAHWMLSRQSIASSRVFHQWLQLAPPSLFSFVEMGSLSINDWQNVMLDTWVNQIIRAETSQQARETIVTNHQLKSVSDIRNLWLTYLMKPSHIGIFYVPDDPDTMKGVRKLEHEIESWHRRLSGRPYHDTKQVLSSHLKQMVFTGFKPSTIHLFCQPDSNQEPFHPYRPWHVKLSLEGTKNEETTFIEGKELLNLSIVNKSWLTNKLDQLVNLMDDLTPIMNEKRHAPYEAALPLNTILWLQKQRELLDKLSIRVDIPTSLDWRSIHEYDVSIDLSVEEVVQSDNMQKTSISDDIRPTAVSLSLNSLINFDWRIAIGDLQLSVQDFKHLVETEQRMIYYKDEWVELPLERMSEAYDELRLFETDVSDKKSAMTNLLRLYVKADDRKTKRVNIVMKDQIETYLQRLVSKPIMESRSVPSLFDGELRPYQVIGFQWLCGLYERGVGGCLADDMGLGKTIQAIAYLLHVKEEETDGRPHMPTLIICPTSVIENWKREVEKFAPSLGVIVHHGPDRQQGDMFFELMKKTDIIITSYHLFVRDQKWLLNQEWHTTILDEAQMIKNPGTKQSQAVRKLKAKQRFALTGTPMENKLDELWSIMDYLNKGYLGSLAYFRSYFITPIEKHGDEQRLSLVRRLVQPFLLRRTKDDSKIIQDLPDKIVEKLYCHLTREQASLYQSIVDHLMQKMEKSVGIERKGLILAAITKLKQVCNHPVLVTGEWEGIKSTRHQQKSDQNWSESSGKLTQFFKILDPVLKKNEKSLVFTQYVKTGQLLRQAIKERDPSCHVFFLYGGIPSEQRTKLIESFRQRHGQRAVFILSLKAGGVGLNLTEANHVIHYDRWWNPAVENQATDRAYRIGQNQHVHVYKLISKGTLEEGIDQLIEKKKWLTDQVIGQGDRWITEMTDDEVLELVQLREKVMS